MKFDEDENRQRIQSLLDQFNDICASLRTIRRKELTGSKNRVIQEMKPEEIKGGMENYIKQVMEKSKQNLEKDFTNQMDKTKKETDKARIEDEIMQSILKESLKTAPKVGQL